MKVDRTCPYCKKDHGSLREIRFYDLDAVRGSTEYKYSVGSKGSLNTRITCGSPQCFKKAMKERAERLKKEET